MGLLDLVKDAGRRIVSTMSLETQARIISQGQSKQAEPIPEDVRTAMEQQNMATGPFTPGEPIAPYQPVGTDPIVTPFMVGQNIFAVPRGVTGVGFDALTNITSKWDVARLCIEVRLDEIRALDWEIVCEEGFDTDLYADELKAARKFFEHPAPGDDFDDLQMKVGEDWLRYDALCIARRRTRNGKLGAIEAIDGTTIAPLIDGRGAMPRYPAPAYVQWGWGLPWVWLTEKDIIYKPHHPRTQTRYGLPPAEWVLLTANTDIRLQWYFLTYFTEGEVPEAFVTAPPDVQDPKQVEALQRAYEAVMSGARAAHHKVKWIPPGSHVTIVSKGNFDVDFAGWLLAKACAAFKVQPAEIGFTEKVNKSSGDTQADITYRRTIKPTVKYFESIWNRILREDLNMPYARFKYLNVEEEEDQLKLAQTREIYIRTGVLSADEVRSELGYKVDPDAPVGRAFATNSGLIFVDPKSQKAARLQGSMAQQAGLEPTADPSGAGETNDDASDDNPVLLRPDQTIVDPELKPIPPRAGQAIQETTPSEKAIQDELRKWRQVAVKRAKEGKAQKVFASTILDPLLHKVLMAHLQKAKTPDEVRAAFAPLLGGDAANFTKRTDRPKPRRGLSVNRDEAKYRAKTKDFEDELALILKGGAPKVAGHVRKALDQTDNLQDLADNPARLDEAFNQLDWEQWDEDLTAAVVPSLVALYKHGAEEGVKALGMKPDWDAINPLAVKYAEDRAAELVGKRVLEDGTVIDNPDRRYVISDSTREMIKDYVIAAIKEGASPYEIEQGIKQHYAFSDARAETIARTETGFAYNRGAIAGYRQAGVTQVEVIDGEDDEECAAANGQIWSLDEAEADPLAHPNCTRAFLPIMPEENDDQEGSDEGE
jgi:SPP1 gp7 family putative phage head morphogenesis protein